MNYDELKGELVGWKEHDITNVYMSAESYRELVLSLPDDIKEHNGHLTIDEIEIFKILE